MDQPAFRYLPIPDQPIISNIIGQRCDEQGIFSEAAAHLIQFPQIGSQQRIRLRFHHAAGASGARLPDSLALPQKTYELDTQTTVSAVSDLTKGLYNKDTLMQKAIEIQGASEIDVDFDKKLKQLVQKGGLLKSEGREVEKLLMNNNPEDGVTGGATLWKLTQGITAFAREQEPERCRELHEISGQLMNRVKTN